MENGISNEVRDEDFTMLAQLFIHNQAIIRLERNTTIRYDLVSQEEIEKLANKKKMEANNYLALPK